MLSDIEIAQQAKMQKITDVAAKLGISEDDIELYGRYKAKLSMDLIRRMENEKPGKLVLDVGMIGQLQLSVIHIQESIRKQRSVENHLFQPFWCHPE